MTKVKLIGIKWDVFDELEDGQTYEEFIKEYALPNETTVVIDDDSDDEDAKYFEALDIASDKYGFCITGVTNYTFLD